MLWVLCLTLVTWMTTTRALEYSDLETINFETCPEKNSCQRMGDAPFLERNCECDPACGAYGDCCIDAPRFPVFEGRGQQQPRHICLPYGNVTGRGAYVISSCPRGYSGPALVARQCQSNDFSDPLLSTPVTDPRSGRTYLNRYCALCHDAPGQGLRTWILSACRVQPGREVTWEDMEYREDLHLWGVRLEGEFQGCGFHYDAPREAVGGLRDCWVVQVSGCRRNWRQAGVAADCRAYTSVVTASGRLYRNPHCALCNGVRAVDMACYDPGFVNARKAKPFSFALLLDVNRSDGDLVGVSQRCPSGQKYDPFFKKCRTLTCAVPGFKMINGKCVSQ